MEKAKTRDNQQSRLRTFLAGDTFKALLPLIGFVIIIVVLNIMTQGKILTPKKLPLLFSQIYYPTIVAVGVFFVMTLGSIDFTEGSTLGVASLVVSALSFINIPVNTAIMRVVDRDKLSKVNSIISIGCQGMIPIASVLAGMILQSFGSSVLLFFCALGFTAAAVFLLMNKPVREL